jgi:hypothetical protein
VLETSAFRGVPVTVLERLTDRGFVISVSEAALTETWAHSLREYERTKNRRKCRGLLFKRAHDLRHVVDVTHPIALTGSDAIERIRCHSHYQDEPPQNAQASALFAQHWRQVSGIGYTDEEWLQPGEEIERWLSEVDDLVFKLARPLSELLARDQADTLEDAQTFWKRPRADVLETLNTYLARTCWEFDDAVAERLDAHSRTAALRLYEAAKGARTPKVNDGVDSRFTVHLGENAYVLTETVTFSPWSTRAALTKRRGCVARKTSTSPCPTVRRGVPTHARPLARSNASARGSMALVRLTPDRHSVGFLADAK